MSQLQNDRVQFLFTLSSNSIKNCCMASHSNVTKDTETRELLTDLSDLSKEDIFVQPFSVDNTCDFRRKRKSSTSHSSSLGHKEVPEKQRFLKKCIKNKMKIIENKKYPEDLTLCVVPPPSPTFSVDSAIDVSNDLNINDFKMTEISDVDSAIDISDEYPDRIYGSELSKKKCLLRRSISNSSETGYIDINENLSCSNSNVAILDSISSSKDFSPHSIEDELIVIPRTETANICCNVVKEFILTPYILSSDEISIILQKCMEETPSVDVIGYTNVKSLDVVSNGIHCDEQEDNEVKFSNSLDQEENTESTLKSLPSQDNIYLEQFHNNTINGKAVLNQKNSPSNMDVPFVQCELSHKKYAKFEVSKGNCIKTPFEIQNRIDCHDKTTRATKAHGILAMPIAKGMAVRTTKYIVSNDMKDHIPACLRDLKADCEKTVVPTLQTRICENQENCNKEQNNKKFKKKISNPDFPANSLIYSSNHQKEGTCSGRNRFIIEALRSTCLGMLNRGGEPINTDSKLRKHCMEDKSHNAESDVNKLDFNLSNESTIKNISIDTSTSKYNVHKNNLDDINNKNTLNGPKPVKDDDSTHKRASSNLSTNKNYVHRNSPSDVNKKNTLKSTNSVIDDDSTDNCVSINTFTSKNNDHKNNLVNATKNTTLNSTQPVVVVIDIVNQKNDQSSLRTNNCPKKKIFKRRFKYSHWTK